MTHGPDESLELPSVGFGARPNAPVFRSPKRPPRGIAICELQGHVGAADTPPSGVNYFCRTATFMLAGCRGTASPKSCTVSSDEGAARAIREQFEKLVARGQLVRVDGL